MNLEEREKEIIAELNQNEENRNNLVEALNKTDSNKSVIIGRLLEVQDWIKEEEKGTAKATKNKKEKIT